MVHEGRNLGQYRAHGSKPWDRQTTAWLSACAIQRRGNSRLQHKQNRQSNGLVCRCKWGEYIGVGDTCALYGVGTTERLPWSRKTQADNGQWMDHGCVMDTMHRNVRGEKSKREEKGENQRPYGLYRLCCVLRRGIGFFSLWFGSGAPIVNPNPPPPPPAALAPALAANGLFTGAPGTPKVNDVAPPFVCAGA